MSSLNIKLIKDVEQNHQVFMPSILPAVGNIATRMDGYSRTINIYTLPSSLGIDQVLTIIAYLTPFGRSDDQASHKFGTWMYSLVAMAFKHIQEPMQRENTLEYCYVPFPQQTIDVILELANIARGLNMDGTVRDDESTADSVEKDELINRDYTNHLLDLSFPLDFPDLDITEEFFPQDLVPCIGITPIYGFMSLIFFLAGKQITETNSVTITARRPRNLIDTYKIPEQARFFLSGEGKMTMNALTMCNNMWTIHTPLRIAIISQVAHFSQGSSLAMRVVYTVSKLLEYVGMQQALYINQFLIAHPEAMTYNTLRPSLAAYVNSMNQLKTVDPIIRPYFKVIYGDQTRIFHRNSLLTLASVAIAYQRKFNDSIRHYNLGAAAGLAIGQFEEEARSKNHPQLLLSTHIDLNQDKLT